MTDDSVAHPSGHPLAAGIRGLHHKMVSTANQRAVLMVVATNPGITNAEISRRVGLGPQTVSRFLGDLESSGLIRRGEPLRGVLGQPAIPYSLVYDSVGSLGLAIGPRRCVLVLMDMSGVVRRSVEAAFDGVSAMSALPTVAGLFAEIATALTRPEREKLASIGVCLSADAGQLLGDDAPDELAAGIAGITGVSAHVYDEGVAGAWAEHAGPGSPWQGDFGYIFIGDAIASGMVRGGQLWRGRHGHLPGIRVGDMMVAPPGLPSTRLDRIASLMALEERWSGRQDVSSPAPPEQYLVETTAHVLALSIVNLAAATGIRQAVLGGSLEPSALDRLCAAVRGEIERLSDGGGSACAVGAGLAGRLAPAIGASYLPIYEQLFSREAVG